MYLTSLLSGVCLAAQNRAGSPEGPWMALLPSNFGLMATAGVRVLDNFGEFRMPYCHHGMALLRFVSTSSPPLRLLASDVLPNRVCIDAHLPVCSVSSLISPH